MIITKYKIFENQDKMILTEELMKSILEKELFTQEVIEYFEYYNYPFYPLSSKYDYSYDKKEDKHLIHYEFENIQLGIITSINFSIRNFSVNLPYFKVHLYIGVDFKKEKNLFETPKRAYSSSNIYNTSNSEDIFKTSKGKEKQTKTLINQIKSNLKKIIKENVFKYGTSIFIKEILIGYKFIQEIEKLYFVKDYTDIRDYPNKKDFKIVKYEDSVLKTTNPWVYSHGDYIRLYFKYFDRVFILHEQYIYRVKKIYNKVKKEVENEINNQI